MITNKITACLQELKSRLYPATPRHPLIESEVSLDEAIQKTWVKASGIDVELAKDIEDTKKTATTILEGLVKRSEIERRRLELIFDSLDDAVLMTDQSCLITAVNEAARRLFGIQTRDFIGKRVAELIPLAYPSGSLGQEYEAYKEYLLSRGFSKDAIPEEGETNSYADLKGFYADYLRTRPSLIGVPKYTEYVRADGTNIPVKASLNPLTLDPFAEDFGYLVVLQDCTESRTAEAEVQRLKSFTLNLMAVTQIPIFNKDTDLRFTFVNNYFRELVQLEDEDIIGKSVAHMFDTESAQALIDLDLRALATDELLHDELRLKTSAGTSHQARVFSRSIRDGGVPTGVTGSILLGGGADEGMRNSVFEAAAKSIVFLDSHSFITGCNDEFLRLIKMTKGEVVGRSGLDAVFSNFIGTGIHTTVSDSIRVGTRVFNRMCTPILNSDGSIEGAIYVYYLQTQGN